MDLGKPSLFCLAMQELTILLLVKSMEEIGNLILDDLEVPTSMRK